VDDRRRLPGIEVPAGAYSGVKDINDRFDTAGSRFLRGHQVTDRDGIYRSGGTQLLLDVTEDEGGYRAVFDIGLQDG